MGFHETPLPRLYRALGTALVVFTLIIVVCLALIPVDRTGFALCLGMGSVSAVLGGLMFARARRADPQAFTSVFLHRLPPAERRRRIRLRTYIAILGAPAVTLSTAALLTKLDSGALSPDRVPAPLVAMHDLLGRWPTVTLLALLTGASWAILAGRLGRLRREDDERHLSGADRAVR